MVFGRARLQSCSHSPDEFPGLPPLRSPLPTWQIPMRRVLACQAVSHELRATSERLGCTELEARSSQLHWLSLQAGSVESGATDRAKSASKLLVLAYIVTTKSLWTWLRHMGGPGLVVLGLADNSLIPLPGIMDVLTIWLVVHHPRTWYYYMAMATVGAL